jgi:hypothetical protein
MRLFNSQYNIPGAAFIAMGSNDPTSVTYVAVSGYDTHTLPSFNYSDQGVNRRPYWNQVTYENNVTDAMRETENVYPNSSRRKPYPAPPNNTDGLGTWKRFSSWGDDLLFNCKFYVTGASGTNQTAAIEGGAVKINAGHNLYSSVYDSSTNGSDNFDIGNNNWNYSNHPNQYTVYPAGYYEIFNWVQMGRPNDMVMTTSAAYGHTFYGYYEDRFMNYSIWNSAGVSGISQQYLAVSLFWDYKYMHARFD